MGFWRFCEKVSIGVGLSATLNYIHLVCNLYENNKTVGEVIDAINARKLDDPTGEVERKSVENA